MCSPTWETHIPSDMCSPTWETHIPSDMCSPTWQTHIPSNMCFPTWETDIPCDMCCPTWKHLSLVMCVALPGKHVFLVICVPLLRKTFSLWYVFLYQTGHVFWVSEPGFILYQGDTLALKTWLTTKRVDNCKCTLITIMSILQFKLSIFYYTCVNSTYNFEEIS